MDWIGWIEVVVTVGVVNCWGVGNSIELSGQGAMNQGAVNNVESGTSIGIVL